MRQAREPRWNETSATQRHRSPAPHHIPGDAGYRNTVRKTPRNVLTTFTRPTSLLKFPVNDLRMSARLDASQCVNQIARLPSRVMLIVLNGSRNSPWSSTSCPDTAWMSPPRPKASRAPPTDMSMTVHCRAAASGRMGTPASPETNRASRRRLGGATQTARAIDSIATPNIDQNTLKPSFGVPLGGPNKKHRA